MDHETDEISGISRKRAIQPEIFESKFPKMDGYITPKQIERMDESDSELSWDDASHSYEYNNYRIKRGKRKAKITH